VVVLTRGGVEQVDTTTTGEKGENAAMVEGRALD